MDGYKETELYKKYKEMDHEFNIKCQEGMQDEYIKHLEEMDEFEGTGMLEALERLEQIDFSGAK